MSIFSGRQVSLQNAMPMGQENIAPPTPRRRGLFSFAPMAASDRLMALGAMLSDIGNGTLDNSVGVMQMRRQRDLDTKAAQDRTERLAFERDRANRPTVVNTTGGVGLVTPSGKWSWAHQAPPETLAGVGAIPTGMVRDETGALRWAPGYVGGQEEVGRVRRRTIVDNPMPRAPARSSGGSAARSAGVPAGWVLD